MCAAAEFDGVCGQVHSCGRDINATPYEPVGTTKYLCYKVIMTHIFSGKSYTRETANTAGDSYRYTLLKLPTIATALNDVPSTGISAAGQDRSCK